MPLLSKKRRGRPKRGTQVVKLEGAPPRQSKLERKVSLQIKVANLPTPEMEYRFHATRKWRFDFCWPSRRVALEVEGGVFGPRPGRHTTPLGFHKDCDKYNAAAIDGWRVLRVTSHHIQGGEIVPLLEEALFTDD